MQPVAEILGPLVETMVGSSAPVRIEFWDQSSLGPDDAQTTMVIRSPDAIRRIMWAPGELGLARAYVCGDIDIAAGHDLIEGLRSLRAAAPERPMFSPRILRETASAARTLGVVGKPLPPPPEEASPRGVLHSKRRDAQAVGHHYDISNDFYRLVLGPSMTYSCARFTEPTLSLDEAQAAKHDLICRKLGLHERSDMRLLDVGCGWGSMAIHAATHYATRVVAVTISRQQAELARKRVAETGVSDRVEIRLQDYRDVPDGPYDAISSIGMFEHVGAKRMGEYFGHLHGLLTPTGRLLNHAISSVGGSRVDDRSFVGRYVFPDGHLIDVGDVVAAMETAGFEVRDVESLREHYALTLRQWVDNLRTNWDAAVELVGERRARVWHLYMAGSALGFEDGGISIHQVLGVVPSATGSSGMPPTRATWG
ncbi:MAG: class I SAM-dependent methyltransferase [Acidimicrobiales bacterium]